MATGRIRELAAHWQQHEALARKWWPGGGSSISAVIAVALALTACACVGATASGPVASGALAASGATASAPSTVPPSTRASGNETVAITGLAPPAMLASGPDAIWAGTTTGVARIDPMTNVATPVVSGLPPGGHPVVGVGDAVWVVSESTIVEYDATSGEERTTLDVGEAPLEPLVAYGSIWVPNHHDGTLTRIDPERREVVATITIGPAGTGGPEFMSAGGGLLWASAANAEAFVGIDPATNKVAKEFPVCAEGVAWLFESLWVWECGVPGIQVLDPTTGDRRGTVDIDALKWRVVIDDRVWFPLRGGIGRTTFAAVDPETLDVVDEVQVRGTPETFTVGFESVWLGGPIFTEVLRVPFSVLESG